MQQIRLDQTRFAHADVMGEETLRGKLLGSGPILAKIDLVVSNMCHSISGKASVTVAFDTFKMLRPVFHGDFVRLEAQALTIGRTSMVAQVSVYRNDFATNAFHLTHNAVVTFVIVGDDGRPVAGMPQLHDPEHPTEYEKLRDWTERRKELSRRWNEQQAEVTKIPNITHDMIPKDERHEGRQKVNMVDTIEETRNPFLLKHANLSMRNVFGGVLLEWMDRAALHCARKFTKNLNMVTIGMNRVHFKMPILVNDVVSIRARVCRVKKYSVEVEIAVYRMGFSDIEEKHTLSHTGYFEVLNLEEDNRRREIFLGITASEKDQDSMQALLRAHRRQAFEKEDAELLSMPPIPISISKQFSDIKPRL